MKRALAASPKQADTGLWPDAGFVKKYPNIVAHLSDSTWEDGAVRELSSLSLKFQDGLVLAVINDQDGKRSLYRAGPGVSEALQLLEKGLEDPTSDWRAWNQNTKKKRS